MFKMRLYSDLLNSKRQIWTSTRLLQLTYFKLLALYYMMS